MHECNEFTEWFFIHLPSGISAFSFLQSQSDNQSFLKFSLKSHHKKRLEAAASKPLLPTFSGCCEL
jgi:hypothetical protein